jgi:hypothetical protein
MGSDAKAFFQVNRIPTPCNNAVTRIQSQVKIIAESMRTKYQLQNFHKVPAPLTITYPVEISVIRGGLTIVEGDRIPIVVKLRNHSLVNVGSLAATGRILRLDFSILGDGFNDIHASLVVAGSVDGNSVHSEYSMQGPLVCEVHFLAAGEELLIPLLLSISDDVKRAHQHIPLSIALVLGDIDRPLTENACAVIQREVHEIQIANYCQPLLENDMLLVINHKVTSADVEHWKAVAAQVKMQVNIWNVSLYYNFSLTTDYKALHATTI